MNSSLLGFSPYRQAQAPKYPTQQILALGQRLLAVVTREQLPSDTTAQPRPTSRRNQTGKYPLLIFGRQLAEEINEFFSEDE